MEKELLRLLKRDGIISEGEYQRIWNDYKQLHKPKAKDEETFCDNKGDKVI